MREHPLTKLTLLALLLLASATPVLAKEAGALRPIRIDDYFALKNVGSPQVSPDGEWVAYTVRTQDLAKDRRESRV
jgi:hypothetical protein